MLKSRAQEPCSNCSKTDALFAQNLLTKHNRDLADTLEVICIPANSRSKPEANVRFPRSTGCNSCGHLIDRMRNPRTACRRVAHQPGFACPTRVCTQLQRLCASRANKTAGHASARRTSIPQPCAYPRRAPGGGRPPWTPAAKEGRRKPRCLGSRRPANA